MSKINKGFNPEKQKSDETATDWIFGAKTGLQGFSDEIFGLVVALYAWPNPINGVYQKVMTQVNHVVCFFQQKWDKYFPKGEVQKGKEDFMDCVTRGFNNEIEKQINYALDKKLISPETHEWMDKNGYLNSLGKAELSDRFTAILSGTTRNGNSMKAPIDSIHRDGCIPKTMLPKSESMTFDQYHDKEKITKNMLDLGQEFLKHFTVNYLTVFKNSFGAFADGVKWDIFDNYDEDPGEEEDFVKRLAPDYVFYPTGYQVIINEIPQPKKKEEEGENMTFYKEEGSPKIYLRGADGLYHWIPDEPTFKALFGDFSQYKIEQLGKLNPDYIGFTIYNKQSLSNVLQDFIKILGRRN